MTSLVQSRALETGEPIDYDNCTDAEKEFITGLVAIYAVCYLTAGSAVGARERSCQRNASRRRLLLGLENARWLSLSQP